MPGTSVFQVNFYYFYDLGLRIHRLDSIRVGMSGFDLMIILDQAHKALVRLYHFPSLDVALLPLSELVKDVEQTIKQVTDTGIFTEPSGLITQEWLADLKNKLSVFEDRLALDSERLSMFLVSDKGIYSTAKLLAGAEWAFPESTRDVMPDAAREDFRSAGRALAFELATACGFHTIRATEAMIQKYYSAVTGLSNLKTKDRNWGAYVRNLSAHKKKNPGSKVDAKLVNLIDQVREHHRNPVMHPEVVLSVDEAHILFNVCQGVIIGLARGIKAVSP